MNKITENIKEYTGIGVVKYVYNRKARNFSIRINQKGEIRVTVPRAGSHWRAEQFLLERMGWVKARLSEIRNKNSELLTLTEGAVIQIRGRQHTVSAGRNGGNLESAFWKLLLKESKSYLPERVNTLSYLHRLPFKELKIKKMKSRWGSCSSGNNINLNSWLILLPDHLIDYVILHELVHTIHKNHSLAFWHDLHKLTGGMARNHRKELRNYRIMYNLEI